MILTNVYFVLAFLSLFYRAATALGSAARCPYEPVEVPQTLRHRICASAASVLTELLTAGTARHAGKRQITPRRSITTFTLGNWEHGKTESASRHYPVILDLLCDCRLSAGRHPGVGESRCIAQIEGPARDGWRD